MKNKTIAFVFLFLGIIIISCSSSSKINQSNVKPEEIKDLQIIETVSNIRLIENNGNDSNPNENFSKKSKAILLKALMSFNEKLPIKNGINIFNQNIKNKIENEIINLFNAIDKLENISTLNIPTVLDSVLEANSKRFGLLTFTSGFTTIKEKNSNIKQSENNFSGDINQSDKPKICQSTVCMIIVDSKEDNIAFYKKSSLDNEEPIDLLTLKKQIKEIFEGYFL